MKRQTRILAGTAIGLLMASAPLGASPLSGERMDPGAHTQALPLLFAQAQVECEGEDCPPQEEQQPPAEEAAPAEESAPAPEAAPAPEPAPEPQAAPEAEPAPEPEPQPQAAPESQQAPAEEAAPSTSEPDQPQMQETTPEQPAVEEQTPEPIAPAEQAAPEQPQEAPAEEMKQPMEEAPSQQQPAEQPAVEQPAPQQPAETQPTSPDGEPAQSGEPSGAQTTAQPTDPNQAPLLDSQKEEAPAQQSGEGQQAEQPPAEAVAPPESDAAATEAAQPSRIEAVTEERGTRRERAPDETRRREERPDGVDVLREIGDRIILQLGGQTFVDSNERPRMTRGAREVYYEDLPRGRTRETIIRDNGVQIVTIRDRYGDVIRRSRITPDGREYVLVYVDEDNYGRVREWRDPGLDLPPMRLNIPRRDYILESEYVDDPNDYYEFLERPPVEKVQRLYSVDEVKRSARVRDIARRVDLDTLTFEFGSATIPESEITRLEGVAGAMEKLLNRNPAETFLIEGHTDAVGSDVANLALSDRRAEAVAEALTSVFGIPPENLATQGYGERYLKVKTEAPERENRRVAIRRITPLVAPVASAN